MTTAMMWQEMKDIGARAVEAYSDKHTDQVKILDMFVFFLIYLSVIQIIYKFLVGEFPYNSFLASFYSACGTAVLALSLRFQHCLPEAFPNISSERSFSDFLICRLLLQLTV
eukprot:CAMPEP_0113849432 /NCGR_PEP_ID=MMETSP0372-20130328/3140_1 /TAXON_ID=340204 /ORGANISM="Lankesteria abbotti" /LENGTH=111 /DNA_ID=CAMNT_0000819247 /DNA_START=374 /DNA_END=705 /DNA_ORIENTATION=+ /assembly_acc=CAM_ASM_000359